MAAEIARNRKYRAAAGRSENEKVMSFPRFRLWAIL